MTSATLRRDRYVGAMVGMGIGDSLLAEFENRKAVEICADLYRAKGLVYRDYVDPWRGKRQMKAGQPTDDSELAAALGYSLVVHQDFNEADCYLRLRSFIHGRQSVLTDGEAYGSGGTLRAALRPPKYEQSLLAFEWGYVSEIPSNGSLMRSIAVPLRHCGDFEKLADVAARQSRVTHRHPTAVAACVAYSVMVAEVLDGLNPRMAWQCARALLAESPHGGTPAFQEIFALNVSVPPTEEEIWPHSGSVLLSLRIALWVSIAANDFRDGLTRVVELGGDTDTYGAIAGGILGAYYGYEGIPEEWRTVPLGHDKLVHLANSLHAINRQG